MQWFVYGVICVMLYKKMGFEIGLEWIFVLWNMYLVVLQNLNV